jgi:Spy/CpxP family protein refolding chaperone
MKKSSSLVGIGFALALAAAALPAQAQAAAAPPEAAQVPGGGAPAPGAPQSWLQGRAAARLGLTEAQKASCQTILEKHRTALAQKRQAAFEARRAFREAFGRPETAPDTLRQLHRTMADQEFEQQLERRALLQEWRAVLTPEQREKAARMEGWMEARRGDRGGGCGYGPMARVRRGMRPEPPAAPAP